MNVLEKILEEIEDVRKIMKSTVATNCFGKECENDDCTVCVCERVIEIIRSHMNDGNDINASDKDGRVSAKERMLIYGYRGSWTSEEIEEMRLLEQALGIRLFAWQKAYIKNGNFRCFGKTTAVIIRILWTSEEIEEMRLLEQALGIRLFAWQKAYIKNGNFRCFGKTTAVIIRILTQGKEPVDLRNYGTIQKYIAMDTPQIMTKSLCDFFKSEVKEIHEKLLAAGIKTNPVFYYGTIQKYIAMDTPQIMTKSLCDFFKSEVKEIHEKLLAAGIKTNPVFYAETDKRNFYERKK